MNLALRLVAAALAAFATLPAAHAQAYPSKPVRVIASFAAGGGVDLMARLVAQRLQERLGQPFVVENRPGAGGSIGADAVAKAAPDGYTILAGGNPELTFMPVVNDKLPYDPQRDLAPLALAANAPSIVVAHPSAGIADMKQLLERARGAQGLPYGTPGRGTPMHLAFELLNLEAGTKLVHVPYKGGGPATADVVSGQVAVAVINAPPVLPHIKAGKLRALAVMQGERTALLPEVPTFAETTGIRSIEAPAWFAFSTHAKAPPEVRAKLADEIRAVLADKDVKAKLAGAGLDVVALPPERMAEIIRAELAYNAASVKCLGYRPE